MTQTNLYPAPFVCSMPIFTEAERRHNAKVRRIDVAVHFFVISAMAVLCGRENHFVHLQQEIEATGISRLAVSFVLFAVSVTSWGFLIFTTEDKKTFNSYKLKDTVGHFCFLTHIVFSLIVAQATLDFVSKFALYQGLGHIPIFGQTQLFLYRTGLLVHSTGVIVTILFMKMCWYDEVWQRETRMAEKENPLILVVQLYGHWIPAFNCFFDLLLNKDPKLILLYGVSFTETCIAFTVFAVFFQSWMELLHYITKAYPYPFLRSMDTLFKRIMFVLVVLVFAFCIFSVLQGMVWVAAMFEASP